MDDDDLILVDDSRSLQWNYVNRVERELSSCNDYRMIMVNSLLPRSYREVVMVLARACNHSRVALLIDEDEKYVAFMLVVDEDCVPFLLDGLGDIVTPITCVYKVFFDSVLACSGEGDGCLHDFIEDVVIPDLNENFESWKCFGSGL